MAYDVYGVTVALGQDAYDEFVARMVTGIPGRLTLAIQGSSPTGQSIASFVNGDLLGNRVTITDLTPSTAEGIAGVGVDQVWVGISATGPMPQMLGDNIIEAAGLDEDAVEEPALAALLREVDSDAAERPVEAFILTTFIQWASGTVRAPLVVACGDGSIDSALSLVRKAKSMVDPFVRDYTPVLPLDTGLRRALNGVLERDVYGEVVDRPVTVPLRAITVLTGDAKDDTQRSRTAAIATKTTMSKPDGRRIAAAIARGGIALPDFASAMTDLVSGPPSEGGARKRTARDEDDEGARASADLERRLQREQARSAALDAERSGLARRLRLAEHALATYERGDDPAEDAVETDEHSASLSNAEDLRRTDLDLYSRLIDRDIPDSVAGVCALARETLSRVVVPLYVDGPASSLDVQSRNAAWAQRAWRLLCAMEAFAAAVDAPGRGNFRAYCAAIPEPPINPAQIAMRESRTVEGNARMRRERTFVVPPEVNDAGEAYMGAHARVAADGAPPAPRMYFLDDTRGATGKVHVGYVGPHLTNISSRHT